MIGAVVLASLSVGGPLKAQNRARHYPDFYVRPLKLYAGSPHGRVTIVASLQGGNLP